VEKVGGRVASSSLPLFSASSVSKFILRLTLRVHDKSTAHSGKPESNELEVAEGKKEGKVVKSASEVKSERREKGKRDHHSPEWRDR